MPKRSASSLPRAAKRRNAEDTLYGAKAADTWIAVGNCAATMGIFAMATKAFELALVHAPGLLAALVGWSHLLRMNDIHLNETHGLQTLIQRLAAAAEQFPELAASATFFRELTECYLLVGLNDQAHQAVRQAVQLQPNDPALCLLLAQTLIRAGARAQAAAALTHCLRLLPPLLADFAPADIETARSAHAELAAIAAADGNIDLLIAELTATLLLPPPPPARADEHVALWCAFATAKERANRIPEALAACEQAEVAVGPLPRILITHAYLLLLGGARDAAQQAVGLLTRVIDAEPAELRQQRAKDDKADDAEDAPGDFLPWYLLGRAYTLLDAPRAAYDSYQIALRRASGLPITWLAVGKLYLELKQLPDALAAYSQALRLQLNENTPGTAAAWDGLSCVYERCDDQLDDATGACSRAAMCFRAIGDNESAGYYDLRLKKLQAAALGKAPVPPLSEPIGVPNYFLRDLVTLLPNERIAFVQGLGKKNAPGAPTPPPSSDKRPQFAPPPFSDGPYPHPQLFDRPHEMHSMPPQGQHFVHALPQQPMYALVQPFKAGDAKLPQLLPPPDGRHAWNDQVPHQAQHLPGPPLLQQFAPLQNGTMTPPPPVGQVGPHRSPLAHPQMVNEGYPVAGPPGYVYGQYMPMHGGMLAQVHPYGNWRR